MVVSLPRQVWPYLHGCDLTKTIPDLDGPGLNLTVTKPKQLFTLTAWTYALPRQLCSSYMAELDKDGCELTQTVLASLNKVENLATELVINLLHNQYFTV